MILLSPAQYAALLQLAQHVRDNPDTPRTHVTDFLLSLLPEPASPATPTAADPL